MHTDLVPHRLRTLAPAVGLGVAVGASVGAFLPTAYRQGVAALLRRSIAHAQAGHVEPLLRRYAEDVRFVFPGSGSWAADLRGKADVERWLRRFFEVGFDFEARRILVSGPPWDTRVCVCFTDRLVGGRGELIYANRGVIVLKIVWGRIVYHEAVEDTEKAHRLDAYRTARRFPEGAHVRADG